MDPKLDNVKLDDVKRGKSITWKLLPMLLVATVLCAAGAWWAPGGRCLR